MFKNFSVYSVEPFLMSYEFLINFKIWPSVGDINGNGDALIEVLGKQKTHLHSQVPFSVLGKTEEYLFHRNESTDLSNDLF